MDVEPSKTEHTPSDLHTFLGDLHGIADETLWITVQAPTHNWDERPCKSYPNTAQGRSELVCDVAAWGGRHACYIETALHHEPATRASRASTKDRAVVTAFYADLDFAAPGHRPPKDATLPPNIEAALEIADAIAAPSYTIETGGGLQCWWLLDRPYTTDELGIEQTADYLALWDSAMVENGRHLGESHGIEGGYHVDKVGQTNRVLRVPGSIRRKLDKTTGELTDPQMR